MEKFSEFDWESGSVKDQLLQISVASANEINFLGRNYNWDCYPIEVLGAISNRSDCNLGTALTIFCLADPSSYESYSKHRPDMMEFIDRIYNKINCGFYKNDPENGPEDPKLLLNYVRGHPKATGKQWLLDPDIVTKCIETSSAREKRRIENCKENPPESLFLPFVQAALRFKTLDKLDKSRIKQADKDRIEAMLDEISKLNFVDTTDRKEALKKLDEAIVIVRKNNIFGGKITKGLKLMRESYDR